MPGWGDCRDPLIRAHDTLLLDLDGVVYAGAEAIPHAVAALTDARDRGLRLVFVTNNASRTPQTVATHLSALGLASGPDDVVTSAQAAAARVASRVSAGSAVLLVGGEGLDQALRERGMVPVHSAEESPAAVVQGFSPATSWQMLMEACVALRRGVPWVVSNVDQTFPTARGLGPGNGALVDLVRRTTGIEPDEVAGKPFPPIMREAQTRAGGRAPLVVGDRLDTDLEGARRAGLPGLLVLTGVTGIVDLLRCRPERRPDYLAADLRDLRRPSLAPRAEGDWWVGGRARARITPDGRLETRWDGTAARQAAGSTDPADAASTNDEAARLSAAGATGQENMASGADTTRAADGTSTTDVLDMVKTAVAAVWERQDGVEDGERLPPADLDQAARALSDWTTPQGWDR